MAIKALLLALCASGILFGISSFCSAFVQPGVPGTVAGYKSALSSSPWSMSGSTYNQAVSSSPWNQYQLAATSAPWSLGGTGYGSSTTGSPWSMTGSPWSMTGSPWSRCAAATSSCTALCMGSVGYSQALSSSPWNQYSLAATSAPWSLGATGYRSSMTGSPWSMTGSPWSMTGSPWSRSAAATSSSTARCMGSVGYSQALSSSPWNQYKLAATSAPWSLGGRGYGSSVTGSPWSMTGSPWSRSGAATSSSTSLCMGSVESAEEIIEKLTDIIAGREYQLEEDISSEITLTSVTLNKGGEVSFGQTDGPLPAKSSGSWELVGGTDFKMEVTRTFESSKGADPYSTTRSYVGFIDEVMDAEDTVILAGDIQVDGIEIGFYKMISSPSDITDSLSHLDEKIKMYEPSSK